MLQISRYSSFILFSTYKTLQSQKEVSVEWYRYRNSDYTPEFRLESADLSPSSVRCEDLWAL